MVALANGKIPYKNRIKHERERGVVFCQKGIIKKSAESYKGQLCSSAEGQVCWIPEKDFLLKNLAPGMEAVLRLIHDDKLSECYLWNEDGCWKEQFS